MLAQPLKLVAAPTNNLRTLVIRNYSSQNPFTFLIRKFNKIYHGSETPHVWVDRVKEQMIHEGKFQRMPMVISKTLYLREKAQKRYVEHNRRIRKLEGKITGGVYETKGLANKF